MATGHTWPASSPAAVLIPKSTIRRSTKESRPAPAEAAGGLLRPCPDDGLVAEPVGPRVNNVKNDDPSCFDPPDGPTTALE